MVAKPEEEEVELVFDFDFDFDIEAGPDDTVVVDSDEWYLSSICCLTCVHHLRSLHLHLHDPFSRPHQTFHQLQA